MNVIHKIALDLAQNNYIEIEVAKGSENTIVLQFFFLESGKKYDMSEVGAVSFKAITPDQSIVFNDTSKVQENGSVLYAISERIMETPGRTTCTLQLIGSKGEVVSSFEFYIRVKAQLFDENDYISEDDLQGFRAYMIRAENAAEACEALKQLLNVTYGGKEDLIGDLSDQKLEYEEFLEDLKERIANGEFNGPRGEPGKDGADAIVTEGTGIMAFQIIGADLYCYYFGDQPNVIINTDGDLIATM